MAFISNYKDLIVWQKSINLVVEIYKLTDYFPKSEIYGLSSQMKRSAVSISSNIAEGCRRGSKKEYARFLRIAFGSGAELETQIEICKKINKLNNNNFQIIDSLLDEVMRILNKMINNFKNY